MSDINGQPKPHCPTCTCGKRGRYKITDDLLTLVLTTYEQSGIDGVAESTHRSRAQAYRLLNIARHRINGTPFAQATAFRPARHTMKAWHEYLEPRQRLRRTLNTCPCQSCRRWRRERKHIFNDGMYAFAPDVYLRPHVATLRTLWPEAVEA